MKSRLVVPDSEVCKAMGIGRRANLTWMTNCPSTLHGPGVLCYTKSRVLSSLIFRLVREIPGAIILTADPERVRDGAESESEPGIGQQTHD